MQNRNPDSQRTVRKHEPLHVLCGAYKVTLAAETSFEFLPEALEKVNVLRFFAGKLEQSPDAIIVSRELRPRMIHHVGENELFDQTRTWPGIHGPGSDSKSAVPSG